MNKTNKSGFKLGEKQEAQSKKNNKKKGGYLGVIKYKDLLDKDYDEIIKHFREKRKD